MKARFNHCEITLGPEAKKLHSQQKMVVMFLCLGLSTKAIASRLEKSPSSVKKNIDDLFDVFGVSNRGAVIAQAFCHQVVIPAKDQKNETEQSA